MSGLSATIQSAGVSTFPAIATEIRSISAQKLDGSLNRTIRDTSVVFNIGVNIEEAARRSNSVALNFQLVVGTEPSIAKFSIEGTTTITGNSGDIEKLLSVDPKTNIPKVVTPIYQDVYSVLFMLASTLNLPRPSPALLKNPQVRTS